jgi:hypothetical protein
MAGAPQTIGPVRCMKEIGRIIKSCYREAP